MQPAHFTRPTIIPALLVNYCQVQLLTCSCRSCTWDSLSASDFSASLSLVVNSFWLAEQRFVQTAQEVSALSPTLLTLALSSA